MPGLHPRGGRFRSQAQARKFFAMNREDAKETADSMKTKHNRHPISALPGHVEKRSNGHGSRMSSTAMKLPRKVHGSGRPSSRYGGTPGHGRRSEDPSVFTKAFTPTPVLARTKPIAQLAADGGADLSPASSAAQAVTAPNVKGSAGAAGKTNTLAGKLTGLAASKPMTGAAGGQGKLASMGAQQSQKPVTAMGSIGTIGSMSKALPPQSRRAVGRLALMAAAAHSAKQGEEFVRRNKTAIGATAGAYAGARAGHRHHVEKAGPTPMLVRTQRRSHDPERGRQFRLGAATAGTAAGGGLLVASGGKELRRLNREHVNALGGLEHTKLVNLKGGGRAGVGIAGLIGAGQLARYAAGNKNRRWT